MQTQALGGHETILGALFGGLPSGMPFPMALLTVIARQLLDDPTAVWDSIDDVLLSIPTIIINAAEDILDLIGNLLGIPNLGAVLQQLALLPSLLLSAATGEDQDGDNDTILDDLFDVLRSIFGGGTPDEDPTDITPPTAPNLTLNGASYSTITVTASGAVDPP
jgi:hypothetical protein